MAKKNANLGKKLEDRIVKMNQEYLEEGIAVVNKVPNSWVVRRRGPHIIGANPVPHGICDFFGTSKTTGGRTFVFDAKECALKTVFPLKNIKVTQMDHMRDTIEQGGTGFIIVHFTDPDIDECYYLPYHLIVPFWIDAEQNPGVKGKQSIPLKYFREELTEITGFDYLHHVR